MGDCTETIRKRAGHGDCDMQSKPGTHALLDAIVRTPGLPADLVAAAHG